MKKMKLFMIMGIIVVCLCCCSKAESTESSVSDTEYKKLTEDLNTRKADLEKVNKELDSLKEENNQLKKDAENASKENEKLVEENKVLNSDMSKEKKEYDALSDKYDSLQKNYESLETEYAKYKEKMKPFEELDEKEAEVRKIEAEKAIKEEEEKKKKEEEEKAKKKEAEEKKGYDTGITYKQLARTPDDYIGKKIKFTGKVVQVIDGTDEVNIRIAINSDYDSIMLCAYDPSILSFRILEDDKITFYGTSLGLYTYKSTLGAAITIPSAWIDKIELKN
ncbi:MAG: toxin regulator [Lachnospiraceae bacterium]|nr:toxin regulator [Lachnospiraceae bacterium]